MIVATVAIALLVGLAVYHFSGKIKLPGGEAKADEASKPDAQVVLSYIDENHQWKWNNLTTDKAKEKYQEISSLVKYAIDNKKPYVEIFSEHILFKTEDFKDLYEVDGSNQ